MNDLIPGFDRKRGTQHNFSTVNRYFNVLSKTRELEGDWQQYWCDMLLFDALIGNTDRHQDNWGLLWKNTSEVRIAPVFDNGTSLGHEILERKMPGFNHPGRLDSYVARGRHHIKHTLSDTAAAPHAELLIRLLEYWPRLHSHIQSQLTRLDPDKVFTTIKELTRYEVPVPLTQQRARFIADLTAQRLTRLISQLL